MPEDSRNFLTNQASAKYKAWPFGRQPRDYMLFSAFLAPNLLSLIFAHDLTIAQLDQIREAFYSSDVAMFPEGIEVGSHNLDVKLPGRAYSLLHDAIFYDEWGTIPRRLLELGASPNFVCDKDGSSPLLTALNFDVSDFALTLLEKGADVNHVNNLGQTVLMIACAKSNILSPEFWTSELFSNIDKLDNQGRSAFDYLNYRSAGRLRKTAISTFLLLGNSDIYFNEGLYASIKAIGIKYGIENMTVEKADRFAETATSFINRCNEEKQKAINFIVEKVEREGHHYDPLVDVIGSVFEHLDFKKRIQELLEQC